MTATVIRFPNSPSAPDEVHKEIALSIAERLRSYMEMGNWDVEHITNLAKTVQMLDWCNNNREAIAALIDGAAVVIATDTLLTESTKRWLHNNCLNKEG